MHGTVIRSWLLELLGRAYEQHGEGLGDIRGWVADSGEGRWTVQEAIDLDVPAHVITLSLHDPLPQPPVRELLGARPGCSAPAVRRPRGQDGVRRPSGHRYQAQEQPRTQERAKGRAEARKAAAKEEDGWSDDGRHDQCPASRGGGGPPLPCVRAARGEPVARRPGHRTRPGAVRRRCLRRDGRPDLAQDPAGHLQPAPDGPVAAGDDRAGLLAPAADGRRLSLADARVG